ncbi:tetratricopeptide repeat protein [Methylosinus sp. H3A]|uniref:tetratricopeptide repeat protein n=1 Tax=Methylosinus sp. H3A TaxID=2785786 RepID=UPI0018C2B36A|nr:tetratricopeptide repeat protein [Methylosinus sp. H3A]MBG0811423.1 tetratricopeptide repeat protein [Methylosinus sp. H3A]
MFPPRFVETRRLGAPSALAICALLALGGCSQPLSDVTGSIGASRRAELPTDEAQLRRYAEEWGRRYDADPKNKSVALTYAKALHALDRNAQAVAVLQGLAIRYPEDLSILGAYGKSLADAGRLREAADVLSRSHTPERPDWSVLSAQGSIADQLGNHEEAREYYQTALKIKPDDPKVLSNLGLSYALSKQLPQAENTLMLAASQPAADMRVRQNLALVLALQGKFDEAEKWSRYDLSPIDAAANVASIRQMIAQSNSWREIQSFGARDKQKISEKATQRAKLGALTSSAPSPE